MVKQVLFLILTGYAAAVSAQTTDALSRIAFGSGLDTTMGPSIWTAIETAQPQLFLLLDDAVATNSLVTTNRWIRPLQENGNESRLFGPPGEQVQIIQLRTQANRDPTGPNTLLNGDQWLWFREQLRKPALIRIVASDIPVVSEDHQGKKWADWPRERTMLFDMINDTEADGILFISGNRFQAELSVFRDNVPYLIYDLTSSPLNTPEPESTTEINRYGISDVVRDNNFGLIMIDWSLPDPILTLEVRDEKGASRIRHQISLSSLQAENQPLQ